MRDGVAPGSSCRSIQRVALFSIALVSCARSFAPTPGMTGTDSATFDSTNDGPERLDGSVGADTDEAETGSRGDDGSTPSEIPTPRAIAPLSGATVTQAAPTLRWALRVGDGARVEICAERACTTVQMQFDANGTSARVPAPLGPGVHFWRVFGRDAGAVGRVPS